MDSGQTLGATKKADLDAAAMALIAKYGSPLEAVKVLMVYGGKLENTIEDIAAAYPDIVRVSHDPNPPRLG